ncbi:MAG: glycoside hydrolase family 3 N-terminal domain-containing protein, partial [Gemmatimonadaceae bacterium]
MSEIRQLLLPAIRWDANAGYENERASIEQALELGVGGFALFGGEVEEVAKLTSELRERSGIPLLIGSDLERGAGQQFQGATGLPPLAAIGWLDDVDAVRRAARITAREARAVGVNWIYAPVADVDLEPDNPIIGTRAFGGDVARVARDVAAWIEACQAEGVLACAKHFPGHGRTTADSHATLPTVSLAAKELRATDFVPFESAIRAKVASIMSAHIAFPALDPSGTPATLSKRILGDILRDELGFGGLVVTDAMIME